MWLNQSQHKLFHKVFVSFKPVYTNPMENPYKFVSYLSFIFEKSHLEIFVMTTRKKSSCCLEAKCFTFRRSLPVSNCLVICFLKVRQILNSFNGVNDMTRCCTKCFLYDITKMNLLNKCFNL